MGTPRDDGGKRLVAVARGAGAVAFILQDTRDQFSDIGFVVDNEDIGGHDYTVGCGAAAA